MALFLACKDTFACRAVVESMNLIDQNQEDSDFSRNKRSSEASASESPVKRTKHGNTGYGVSSRGTQN